MAASFPVTGFGALRPQCRSPLALFTLPPGHRLVLAQFLQHVLWGWDSAGLQGFWSHHQR